MDMKRRKAGSSGGGGGTSGGEEASLLSLERKVCLAVVWLTFLTVALVVGTQWRTIFSSTPIYDTPFFPPQTTHGEEAEDSSPPKDASLGGLLAGGVDEKSCRSRHEMLQYRRQSPHKPSPYLLQKLRSYEARHRRCGPATAPYLKAARLLTPEGANETAQETDCKYVLWTPFLGLGNRLITLSSAFLYALLTDRVLLIDRGTDFAELFCEPFPGSSWVIPSDFPLKKLYFNRGDPVSYGSLIRERGIVKPLPSFVYAHVAVDSGVEDNRFFFEEDQMTLREVPWLLLRSEVYFAPAFFLNSDFEPELARLFPETDTVFHHLSRYLFYPSNQVWGVITRYYQTYLSSGNDTLGIQIRIFNHKSSPFDIVSRQIINCTMKEKLLPEIDTRDPPAERGKWRIKNVLLATLHYGYLDRIRTLYWEHPAAGERLVSVHQPSHEEWQRTDNENHDMKAWAEMNLLSFSDFLVTSAWSTFGYTAQGLGGLRPWILATPSYAIMPEPSCFREVSMEPCYHLPPAYLVEKKMEGGKGKAAPYVRRCLDVEDGLKIYGRNSFADGGR